MNTDLRIKTGFPTHPKTIRLIRRAGYEAVFRLIQLWSYAAQYRPDGILGEDVEGIEIGAGWTGQAGELVEILVDVGFLDKAGNGYLLHNWPEHNPWAANAKTRSEIARTNINKRWEKRRGSGTSPKPENTPDTNGIQSEYKSNTDGNTPLPSSPILSLPIHNYSSSDDEVFTSKKGKKLSGKRLTWFKAFWEAFNYKQGKAEAVDAWLGIEGLDGNLAALITAGAKREAENRKSIVAAKLTPKMAQGWLTGRRWEDEKPALKTATDWR